MTETVGRAYRHFQLKGGITSGVVYPAALMAWLLGLGTLSRQSL